MSVLHIPYCFYSDPVGGTEVYVEGLAWSQARLGLHAEVAAPGERNRTYVHDGLTVHRFQTGVPTLRELYGEGDGTAAAAFARILDSTAPDLVHLHAFTSGVSLRLVRAAKGLGLPVVFTYHTPTVSCGRGTLLRWGREICDGKLDLHQCARCTLHGLGLSRPFSVLAGSLPPPLGRSLGKLGLAGGAWTALRMTELVQLRHEVFHALMDEVDHVVAVCEWVRELLLRNGVDSSKVSMCRQGFSGCQAEQDGLRPPEGPLRVAFLGRLSAVKGVHVLVEAVLRIPELPLRLDVFGVVQDDAGQRLLGDLTKKCVKDSRLRFLRPMPAAEVIPALKAYDVLAVPSQCLETGPLAVYEAFAAGLPVVGSDLGGIAELVQHEVNGLLVRPNLVPEWAQTLRRLVEEPQLLATLRKGVRPPRRLEDVALEMLAVYERLVAPRAMAC